ncbi:lyase family protein, partial [Acinetobacter baumannii]
MANYSPLGAAALAGTSFPIDREATAQELGFTAPIPNALDATSDRSYILDALHLCGLIMIDLSRISQELVL